MTSGRLRLDTHAAPAMTMAYGAVRPAIGGVLGMALFVLFEGGLLPAVEVADEARLPFYAAVGFLAGFNERFAQDMLAGSEQLTRVQGQRETDPGDDDRTQDVPAR
jgi:hypothetical protein